MKGIDVIVEQAGSRYQIAVVRVRGQIDTTTSHELERRLQYLLKDRQFEIVIELSKVTYISSAGWGIFISEIRGIRESGGDLKLVGMIPEVAEVFELLEFHNILESFKTVEAAVERFESPKAPQTPPAQEKHETHGSVQHGGPVAQSGAIPAKNDQPPAQEGESSATGDAPSLSGAVSAGGYQTGTGESGRAEGREARDSKTDRLTKDSTLAALRAAKAATSRIDNEYAAGNLRREEPKNEAANATKQRSAGQPTVATPAIETAQHPGNAGSSDAGASTARPVSKDLEAMILEIVREHPDHGCLKIRKEILEHDYRRPINPLALFMELKRLGLETKEKRRRYADSVATVGSRR